MTGRAVAASSIQRGFDINRALAATEATAFVAAGYAFVVRYLGRLVLGPSDLSTAELELLTAAGLGVMAVQHVESETSWTPTDAKGDGYGNAAGEQAKGIGLAPGVTVWLDLEGVAVGTDPEQTIRYCNRWFDQVAAAGFQPGLYVGWHSGLTPDQLRNRLRFTLYWGAYNLNADEYPAACGISMKQHAAKVGDVPPSVRASIDTDMIIGDALGRFPTLHTSA